MFAEGIFFTCFVQSRIHRPVHNSTYATVCGEQIAQVGKVLLPQEGFAVKKERSLSVRSKEKRKGKEMGKERSQVFVVSAQTHARGLLKRKDNNFFKRGH